MPGLPGPVASVRMGVSVAPLVSAAIRAAGQVAIPEPRVSAVQVAPVAMAALALTPPLSPAPGSRAAGAVRAVPAVTETAEPRAMVARAVAVAGAAGAGQVPLHLGQMAVRADTAVSVVQRVSVVRRVRALAAEALPEQRASAVPGGRAATAVPVPIRPRSRGRDLRAVGVVRAVPEVTAPAETTVTAVWAAAAAGVAGVAPEPARRAIRAGSADTEASAALPALAV